jgi:hypothetical protein
MNNKSKVKTSFSGHLALTFLDPLLDICVLETVHDFELSSFSNNLHSCIVMSRQQQYLGLQVASTSEKIKWKFPPGTPAASEREVQSGPLAKPRCISSCHLHYFGLVELPLPDGEVQLSLRSRYTGFYARSSKCIFLVQAIKLPVRKCGVRGPSLGQEPKVLLDLRRGKSSKKKFFLTETSQGSRGPAKTSDLVKTYSRWMMNCALG